MKIFNPKKAICTLLSIVMGVAMMPQLAFAAAPGDVLRVGNGTNQHKGISDNFSYEIWLDNKGGSGTMTLGQGATFKAEWSASVPSGNFLARRGLDFGSSKKATDYPYIGMDYEADYRQTGSASGNSRLCVYGWFENRGAAGNVPLVEYYIVEDWVDWVPDSNNFKMVTIDGAQYKVFQLDHTGPTIHGQTETFKQYYSVRQQKRKSGHITVSDHFKAWAAQGWGIGNLYEVALNAEGWQSSGVADVKMLDVYTTPKGDTDPTTPTNPPEPANPDQNGYYFHSTFESGLDSWAARGENNVANSNNVSFAGSQSMYVSGRTNAWNGAGYTLDASKFAPGGTYSFGAAVMQNQIDNEDFKLSLQYNLNGEAHYDGIAEGSAAKGEWLTLSNSAFTIPAGATDLLLYVETLENLTSFYVDEAFGAPKGKEFEVKPNSKSADVNMDGNVNMVDIIAMQHYLLGNDVKINGDAADLTKDGKVNAFDLAALKRYVMNLPEEEPEPEPEPTEPPTQAPTQPPRVEGEWYNTADISWIDPNKPMVALSFDDGPVGIANTDTSMRIQNALANNGFHATFFYCVDLWGKKLNSTLEQEITRAHSLGFEVANHTYSHPDLSKISAGEIQKQINDCKKELTRLTGQENFLIRPPYLAVNQTVQQNAGAPLITCAVDTMDWNNKTAQDMITQLTGKMNDGSLDNTIVLMHETSKETAAAVEYLAPYMKQKGWQIVTISEMFKVNNKVMKDGQIYTQAK